MAITVTDFQPIATVISAYANERWTKERTLSGTGLVTESAEIDTSGEGFAGQLRWSKPLNAVSNVPSLTSAAAGNYSSISTDIASYVKTVRTFGAQQVNLQSLITKQDGLAKFATDLAQARAYEEHNSILAVLKGIAASEVATGAGIANFDTLASDTIGAFVDVNANGAFGAAATGTGDARKLIDASEAGAARGERLFRAMGMFWQDYEPDFAYLVVNPEILAEIRAANLVDETTVTEGNLEFQTIFSGKFRLIRTRANQGNLSASANVNDQSVKTTFVVKPGSIAFKALAIDTPTGIDRDEKAYGGGGSTDIWHRIGYVVHPTGYDWKGATNTFATDTAYGTAASWDRKVDALNLGVLPILHA